MKAYWHIGNLVVQQNTPNCRQQNQIGYTVVCKMVAFFVKSPVSRLCVQQLFQGTIKDDIKVLHFEPYAKGTHWSPVYSTHKGALVWKGLLWYDVMIFAIPGQIEMERKGCESIESWNRIVNLNFDPIHDLDIGFGGVKFWKSCISKIEGSVNTERKGCVSIRCWAHYVTLSYDIE